MALNVDAGRSDDASTEIRLSQAAAARAGDVERLKRLFSEAGQWWEQTADAAFGDGQLETFYWLRTHDPPCPWSFPTQEWASDMHTRGRFSYSRYRAQAPLPDRQKYNLRSKRSSLLSQTLSHASACAERRPAQLFFDELLVQMLDALQCHGCHYLLQSSWAVARAAEGGLEKTLKWLLMYYEHTSKRIDLSAGAFAAAARTGQLSTLRLLLDAHDLCSWDQQCGIEACINDQRPVLDWLRAHGYPWTVECTRQAAASGDVELLAWMRGQSQPWPWDSSVCTAAKAKPAALQWLLHQAPPCPWSSEDAAECPEALASLGDVDVIERLHLPAHVLPHLRMPAVRQGNLQLLKWLQRQQPSCQMGAEVCEAALMRDHKGIVHYLVKELKPPVFPKRYFSAWRGCMLTLAQAACPMEEQHKPQLIKLVESWYTFMGLWQWAANQTAAAAASADDALQHSTREERSYGVTGAPACLRSSLADLRLEGAAANNESNMRVSDALLAHLAQLPPELAHNIAADAFLSPKQASKIQIYTEPLHAFSRLRFDCHEYSPPSSYSDRGWHDSGWPSEDESM